MKRGRYGQLTLAALSLAWLAGACAAHAQQRTPHMPDPDSPRFSFGGGFNFIAGPAPTLNDATLDGDFLATVIELPVPTSPELVLRFDVPLHRYFMLGAQAMGFAWTTELERELGYDSHLSLDLSIVPRGRIAFGSYRKHEIVVSIPLGLTFDTFASDRERTLVAASTESPVGVHFGLGVGYQLVPARKPLGFFGEIGAAYHRIPKTISYQSADGRRAEDEVVYQPIDVYIRAGGMVRFDL